MPTGRPADRIALLEADRRPREAIRAFFAESRSTGRSKDRLSFKGCMLVNSALDVAPHDAELGRVVTGYLEEIRTFFRRNVEAAIEAGEAPHGTDAENLSYHLLGVLMGMRVLSRTGARRRALEAVVQPAIDLLGRPQ
jgi:TetR/AcrR family transcriptional repressor of nem operon